MNKEHTETPWTIEYIKNTRFIKSGDREIAQTGQIGFPSRLGHTQDEANARFIVKACNNYEAMKSLLVELDSLYDLTMSADMLRILSPYLDKVHTFLSQLEKDGE
jgi:hypothetical protein